MNVPMLDLQAQYRSIQGEVDAAVSAVFESQKFVLGDEVLALENEVAEYCGAAHGVGVSSGSDALIAALLAEGIGPGDEVITSAYSFIATAESVVRVGAKPVFADIDADSFNIDPAQVEERTTSRTRAIIPVHLFGRMADMDALAGIAENRGPVVVEDAAQAIGAERGGRRAGSIGDYGCLSFFPSKNLGGAGSSGMVLTGHEAKRDELLSVRAHGARPKYYHARLGGNYAMDAIQAAVLRVKLRYLEEWTDARAANADRYRRLFADTGVLDSGDVSLPGPGSGRDVYNQFVIRAAARDDLRRWLSDRGVATAIYYPVPLHLQECFRDLGYSEGDCPEAERAALESLALPIYPELSDEAAEWVVESIAAFYEAGREACFRRFSRPTGA